MNAQQARIDAFLENAADQMEGDGVIDAAIQMDLAAEGYDLNVLYKDVGRIIANR